MIYLESQSYDPYYNLALEQYVFDRMPRENSYLILWQNDNSIIVGKHQNTVEEINVAFAREHGIRIARRLSGGGAVYHDLGNLNYTIITDGKNKSSGILHPSCQSSSADRTECRDHRTKRRYDRGGKMLREFTVYKAGTRYASWMYPV